MVCCQLSECFGKLVTPRHVNFYPTSTFTPIRQGVIVIHAEDLRCDIHGFQTSEYWTSIKIKISMISVSKGYEIKTKKEATGAMTTAKNDGFFYIRLIWVLVGRGGKNKFLVGWGDYPDPSSWENPVYIYIIHIHIIHINI